MSGWKDGYETFPWCPKRKGCPSGSKRVDLCDTCASVEVAMNAMEFAILEEKKRADKYAEDAWKYRDLCK